MSSLCLESLWDDGSPSVPWQLSLELFPPLGGAPRKGRSLCVLLPLLAPSHAVLVTKPRSWKPKRAQISPRLNTQKKNQTCCGEGRAWLVTHQHSLWFAVASGCWSGSLSWPLRFPLSRSPVAVSGARIPGLRFVSGPSGVVLVPVVTQMAADLHTNEF